MFTGRVAADGACFFSVECEGDDAMFCMSGDTCPGRCVPYTKDGEHCADQTFCMPNHSCEGGVCVAPGTQGEFCSTSVRRCEAGMFCDGTTCQPLRGEGQDCNDEDECEPSLVCMRVEEGRQCRPRRTEGELCTYDECAFGLVCHTSPSFDVPATCWRMRREGERCVFGRGECEFPNVCEQRTGTCVGPAAVGESCLPMNAGARAEPRGCWNSYCAPTQRCTAYTAPGAPCTSNAECAWACGKDRRCVATPMCE
jgi:hypothetical protein